MAQLIVRKLEKEVVLKLKEQAAKYGVSMEEQHRRILRETLMKKKQAKMDFKEFLCTVPDFGEPWKLRKKEKPREIDFD